MGNWLSSLISNDRQVQLEQLPKTEVEGKARELLKQEISDDFSYQELIEMDFTGFMQGYLLDTVDEKTMTTRARRDVVLFLAKSDLLRDLTFSKFLFSESKASVYSEQIVNCLSQLVNAHLLIMITR